MSERYKFVIFPFSIVSKKIKFLFILTISILASSTVAYALVNCPEIRVFPMEYDTSMPVELIAELQNVEKLFFVDLAQHGYNHSENESFEDIMEGYSILKNYSLDISYYIPPFEKNPEYLVPSKLFMIYDEGMYPNEGMEYGTSTLNDSKAIAVHIQNDISIKWLNNITSGRDFEYLRVDDINTDIVDISTQISRIYTMVSFCDRNNCKLVLGIIPSVPRMKQSDKSYLLFNKTMIAMGIMMMMPIYIFYLLSHRLSGWFK
jgi:hypothetical protein